MNQTMNQMVEYKLISACDALIERRQFQEALELLDRNPGVVATWLKGKVHLSLAQAISQDYMFQQYVTLEMKFKYRDVLNEAYTHLFNTAMGLTEASVDFREYLNQYLWRQLGHTENELARTKYWISQDEEEQNSNEEEQNSNEEEQDWTPNPDHLTDHFNDMKLS